MEIAFTWDARKKASNWRKHGVTFEEAIEVLSDPLACTVEDVRHPVAERRYFSVGQTVPGRTSWWGLLTMAAKSESLPLEWRRGVKGEAMKKSNDDDLPSEIDFSGGKRGHFHGRLDRQTKAVVIDRELLEVFPSGEAVNDALRLMVRASQKAVKQAKAS